MVTEMRDVPRDNGHPHKGTTGPPRIIPQVPSKYQSYRYLISVLHSYNQKLIQNRSDLNDKGKIRILIISIRKTARSTSL
jgi:hypothetical protein